jgi:hypothetical protein
MACVIETAMPCALLASFAQALLERGHEVCKLAGQFAAEKPQSPPSPAAARARRERPRGRAADEHNELAALHSITSSARVRRVGGISRPIAPSTYWSTGCSISETP